MIVLVVQIEYELLNVEFQSKKLCQVFVIDTSEEDVSTLHICSRYKRQGIVLLVHVNNFKCGFSEVGWTKGTMIIQRLRKVGTKKQVIILMVHIEFKL